MLKDFDFKKFRSEVESLLKPLESQYDISIMAGTIVYDEYKFRLTLCMETPNDIEERAKFISQCREYGFEPRNYKNKLMINNVEYLFVGFNDSELLPCNILNTTDNKVYSASESLVEDKLIKSDTSSDNESLNGLSIFDV